MPTTRSVYDHEGALAELVTEGDVDLLVIHGRSPGVFVIALDELRDILEDAEEVKKGEEL